VEAEIGTPQKPAPGTPPALALRHFSKRFGGALALNDVALDVMPGEVHGLLGQNGSGKSTLIKILAGFHAPEPGAELAMHARAVPLPIPAGAALGLGLAFVHQHLALVPSLSVLENLRIGRFATETRWRINWRAERAKARETFHRFGLAIDPDARIRDLPQVERALIAIVRAFEDIGTRQDRGNQGVLILDEPTPFLPRAGVDQLFALVRGIVREGTSVIFVSHDVDEVMEITDRATVLRDGSVAGTLETKGATHDDFVELIIGRRVKLFQSERRNLAGAPVQVRIKDLTGTIADRVSIDLHSGEIVGLTGLIGSGSDEIAYLVFGAQKARAGTVSVAGTTFAAASISPPAALAAGMALLPSDRLAAAGVGPLSITDNISLPVLPEFMGALGLEWSRIAGHTESLCDSYEVRPNRPALKLGLLSGGNQQKVLLAKWLQTRPKLLVLDEPTQGVDVGARQALFEALDQASRQGTAVLCASTDYEQLAQICDRVLIFARGRVVRTLTGAEISKDNIAEQCLRSLSLAGIVETEVAEP
jgi:ribose transport system ATP-binding protein